jgi:hypothetical protein
MRSLRHPRSLIALVSLPLLVACGYGDHRHHDGYDDGYSPPPGGQPPTDVGTIESAIIDTDQTLDFESGKGAGIFVEYESGGTYHVTTSCDVDQGDCFWDIIAMPLDRAEVKSVAPADLESDDSVTFGAGNQVRLAAYTLSDFDGFTLKTEPGAALEIDALLDDLPGNRYVFWVGDGALRSGAPSNPMDLVPSEE